MRAAGALEAPHLFWAALRQASSAFLHFEGAAKATTIATLARSVHDLPVRRLLRFPSPSLPTAPARDALVSTTPHPVPAEAARIGTLGRLPRRLPGPWSKSSPTGPGGRLSCGNLARRGLRRRQARLMAEVAPNLGIVTANDMKATRSRSRLPRDRGRHRVAGGVPAMCDGVTQAAPAWSIALLARDRHVGGHRAVARPFRCLGVWVCDKIARPVHGRALGHLPAVFLPAPLTSGCPATSARPPAYRGQDRPGRAACQ